MSSQKRPKKRWQVEKNRDASYYFFIFFIAVVLAISGCDSGTYSAEKRYWHASRAFNRLMQNLESARLEDYQKVIEAFREITIRYPLWSNTPRAQFHIAQLYAAQNNLPQARAEFETILKEYPTNEDICATALFYIGVIYEREGNWDKAMENFNKLTSDYPGAYSALQAPLYVAQHHKNKGQNAEAEAAYSLALARYQEIIRDNPNSFGAVVAEDFAIACFVEQKKWNEAIDFLEGIARDYPDTFLAPKSLFSIGLIYQDRLNEPQKAVEYYRKLIDKYPGSFLVKPAEKQIESLNKLK